MSVGIAERGTPGPIPNPEAKPSSADGTALVWVWESRTPPTILVNGKAPEPRFRGLLLSGAEKPQPPRWFSGPSRSFYRAGG